MFRYPLMSVCVRACVCVSECVCVCVCLRARARKYAHMFLYKYIYRKEIETKMLTSATRSKEHIKEIGNQTQKTGKGKKKRKKTLKKI